MKRCSSVVLLLTSVLLISFTHSASAGVTTRVSVSGDGEQGNVGAGELSISADGRYVAFMSYASNLVTGDTNGKADIFVRDKLAGTTERVSISSDGEQGNGESRYPVITVNGRYVAFESSASNLVHGDTNGRSDIFVRDRLAGTTERISVSSGGDQGTTRAGFPPPARMGGLWPSAPLPPTWSLVTRTGHMTSSFGTERQGLPS